MPNDNGYAGIIRRAGVAPSKAALRRIWLSLGDEYQTGDMLTLFKAIAKGLPE